MNRKPNDIPSADLHTPEVLLDFANTLFAEKNPKMLRASILEAITALEAFVQNTVFENLEGKLDPLLVKWLKDKTRMDFDSRLSPLTEVATGIEIDKKSTLWQNYKESKKLRNKITHSGEIASESDAKFVIDTVYSWLAYLGRTVNLELALMKFKRYIEENHISVRTDQEASSLILEYFGRTQAAEGEMQVPISIKGESSNYADVILMFGKERVIIEHKLWRTIPVYLESEMKVQIKDKNHRIQNPINKLRDAIISSQSSDNPITSGAVIIFQPGDIPESYESIRKYYDNNVYLVVIKT